MHALYNYNIFERPYETRDFEIIYNMFERPCDTRDLDIIYSGRIRDKPELPWSCTDRLEAPPLSKSALVSQEEGTDGSVCA
jgi:hypothetical protein